MAGWRTLTCLLAVAVVATAGGAGTASGAVGTAPTVDGATDGTAGSAANGTAGSAASGQDDGWAVPNRTDEQPGDVARIPVTLPSNETTATVVIANESVGYRLEVTVEDTDGDGVVDLGWNTYHAAVVPAELVADRSVTAGPDRVVDARRTSPRSATHLPEAHYTVSVLHEDRTVATGVVDLESDPLRRASITAVEGPPLGDPAAALARSGITDTVELDEWLFVVVERPGIHGYVDSIDDLTGNGTDGVNFSIRRADTREAVDLSNATFLHFPQYDEFVVGVAPNATILEAGRDYVAEFRVARTNPYAGGGDVNAYTDIRVLPAGAEPDRAVLEVADVTAPGSAIEGHEVTFQVSVVNSGEREGVARVVVTVDGTNVTQTVTVGPRSQRTVDVAFNTSPLTEGTSRWFVRVEGGVRTVTGELEVRLTNETPNTEPTLVPGPRETNDGGQPGFGALAGLVGLGVGIGGRVLALRRG